MYFIDAMDNLYLVHLLQRLPLRALTDSPLLICSLVCKTQIPQRAQRLLVALETRYRAACVLVTEPAFYLRPVLGLRALLASFTGREKVRGCEIIHC